MSLADFIHLFFFVLIKALDIYFYVIVAYCLFSFVPQICNSRAGYMLYLAVHKLARPAFELVEMIIPARFLRIGMISLEPIVIFLGIHLLQIGLLHLARFF